MYEVDDGLICWACAAQKTFDDERRSRKEEPAPGEVLRVIDTRADDDPLPALRPVGALVPDI